MSQESILKPRSEETKLVKRALATAGYKVAKVGHGTGTAWGWLTVKLTVPKPANCSCTENEPYCVPCRRLWDEHQERLPKYLMNVTGRRGEYDGRITIQLELS